MLKILGVILIVYGIWTVFNPERAWYSSEGWKFKNAEPSDQAIDWMVIGGILTIGIGIFALIAL